MLGEDCINDLIRRGEKENELVAHDHVSWKMPSVVISSWNRPMGYLRVALQEKVEGQDEEIKLAGLEVWVFGTH